MQVHISAESCKFTKCLKSRREEEGSEFELECAVESEDGEVTWYFNDIEITPTNNPNFHNFEFISDGKKRLDFMNTTIQAILVLRIEVSFICLLKIHQTHLFSVICFINMDPNLVDL